MTATPKSQAKFQFIGWISDHRGLQVSSKGNPYLRLKVKTVVPVKEWERNFWLVAFGDVAEALAEQTAIDDFVKLIGNIEPSKNQQTGKWENVFTVRQFEVIEKRSINASVDDIKEAFDATEEDPIPF